MTDNVKIMLGVGGVLAAGVGIYLLTRKPEPLNITPVTPINDPSLVAKDSLGSTIGNIFTEIFASENKDKPSGCDLSKIPADPYTADSVTKSKYNSDGVVSMQMYLSNVSNDIKKVIDDSGGTDGKIGPGFKTAYNMARKVCNITGISDLESKSGI